MTTLPTSPGIAVPGQWPGPLFNVESLMPSHMSAASPIFGISIEPSWTFGSVVPSSAGGGSGTGRATVVGGGGVVVVVVVDVVDVARVAHVADVADVADVVADRSAGAEPWATSDAEEVLRR